MMLFKFVFTYFQFNFIITEISLLICWLINEYERRRQSMIKTMDDSSKKGYNFILPFFYLCKFDTFDSISLELQFDLL